MVKVLTFIKRKSGMPVEEFQTYWRTRHPDAVTRLPGIRRYVQSHVLPSAYAKGEPVHDGIAEVWADDTAALRAMTQSPAHPDLIADEARFIDRARMGVIITEEHVGKDSAVGADAVKAVELFTRRESLDPEAFQRHLREVHAELAQKLPGLARYVVSTTRLSAYRSGQSPAYDGAASLWFPSLDVLKPAAASAEYRALVADRANFLAAGEPPFLLTREHVIVG